MAYRRHTVIDVWRALFFIVGVFLIGAPAWCEEDNVRLRATVVLDASQSMNEQDPGQLAVVAARLLVDLATPRDELSLIVFGTKARSLGRGLVTDDAVRGRLYRALAEAGREEWCTDYRVGLQAALDELGSVERPGERRLVIFLTDGLFDPDRSNETYYTTEEGRGLLEKTRAQKIFAERPCIRSYKRLIPHAEPGFLLQMEELIEALSSSGVRLYTVGLGSDLASDTPEASRSRALLQRLASSTGGAFLAATSGDQLPRFFASIYSALVGAPVEEPRSVDQGIDRIGFDVLKGAGRVAVVVDAAGDGELDLSVNAPGKSVPRFTIRPFNVDTPQANGYRMVALERPEPGRYEIVRTRGSAPLKIQVIQEVGLKLAVEGLPSAAPDGIAPQITLALRTSAGEPVTLAPEFLAHIDVDFQLTNGTGATPRVEQKSLRLDRAGETTLGIPALGPGQYTAKARAAHRLGLLSVPDVTAKLQVIHQIEVEFDSTQLTFDVMAEESQELAPELSFRLAEGSELPIEQEFTADWTAISDREDLELGPERFTLGPQKRSVTVQVKLRAPGQLRSKSARFEGKVVLRPVHTELFRGEPEWNGMTVDGHLRPWDFWRYYQEYKLFLWSTLGGLFVLFWIIGRIMAKRWPKKARFHYVDLEDPTKTETSFRVARKSKSHLPFRSDRHRCGRGGTPGKKGKRRYCDVVTRGFRGFRVVPRDVSVSYARDGDELTTRKPFDGKWEERYQLGDRYEIWLTRS